MEIYYGGLAGLGLARLWVGNLLLVFDRYRVGLGIRYWLESRGTSRLCRPNADGRTNHLFSNKRALEMWNLVKYVTCRYKFTSYTLSFEISCLLRSVNAKFCKTLPCNSQHKVCCLEGKICMPDAK